MEDRKLTHMHFEHGPTHEHFAHLQHIAGLSEQSKGRVAEAMKAAVAHIEKKQNLQYGMQGRHVGMALDFLDTHYEGRHDLTQKERDVIENSFKSHFRIKDTPPEPHSEQEETT